MDQKLRLAGNWNEPEAHHFLSQARSSLQGPAAHGAVLLLALDNGPAFTAAVAQKRVELLILHTAPAASQAAQGNFSPFLSHCLLKTRP